MRDTKLVEVNLKFASAVHSFYGYTAAEPVPSLTGGWRSRPHETRPADSPGSRPSFQSRVRELDLVAFPADLDTNAKAL